MAQEELQKEFPPFKPATYFFGNLFLGGLSYLLLRQYLRFFIFFALALIVAFVESISFLGYVIALASAIDAAIIANKMKNKEIAVPEKNIALNIIIIILWVVMIVGSVALFWYSITHMPNFFI
jgi:hypothetical protein